MKILSVETSCDETAVSIVEADGGLNNTRFRVLGNQLLSQIDIHKEYGGVYPMLAKREHAKNLIPLFEEALKEAGLYKCSRPVTEHTPRLYEQSEAIQSTTTKSWIASSSLLRSESSQRHIKEILAREPELLEQFLRLFAVLEKPDIDAVAVTAGPGLEPALWVGVNFARALAHVWNVPVIPANHVEGHIFSALLSETEKRKYVIKDIRFPVLALSIAGGHTELVLVKTWGQYEVVGQTRDDAVGEAFDKVARMLGLPYPGGPEISRLAEGVRRVSLGGAADAASDFKLPRPMIDSDDFDFSFSGLKTAVLYHLKKTPAVSDAEKQTVAREFEDAVTDVLVAKTTKALGHFGAQTLVIEGGVSANTHIRCVFKETLSRDFPDVALRIPEKELSTDNAVMIAVAGYYRWLAREKDPLPNPGSLRANGNLRLS